MKRKLMVSAVILLAVAAGAYFLFFRTSAPEYEFRFDKVSKGDLIVYVTATGTINPVTSVDVGTQVSGIVSKLYADFNSIVKRGQVIAQIDSTFLVQSVKDAEAGVERARAQLADSKRALDRQKALLDKHLDSQVNYDAALTAYETNAAALKSAQASLDRAKINLQYATIYAPISGVVINRAVNVGQTVAASFSSPTLYTIANDLSKMQVLATIDESDIGRISIGQDVTFTVDAYENETFRGTVSQIRLASVAIQNVVNYTVVIGVDNDRLKLMPGMTANVKILVAHVRGVLKVPNMALRLRPPEDLIDTAKLNAMTASFDRNRGGAAGNESAVPDQSASTGPGGGSARRTDAGASREDRGSMQRGRNPVPGAGTAPRAGASSRQSLPQQSLPQLERPANIEKTPQFGIELRFPEYEKSEYVPSHQSGRGRVWILKAGKLEPVAVRTGVTDGRYTEITAPDLSPGEQIVLGVTSKADDDADVKNPLTPSGQRPQMRGGGFR